MKNLKLFVAPILGAALMTACGSKSMDVKDFKNKVEEKFNLDNIKRDYINKKQHVTGTVAGALIEDFFVIQNVASYSATGIYYFKFSGGIAPSYGGNDILSTQLIDNSFEISKQGGATVNYFISDDTYTVEINQEASGSKMSMKYVYNGDLVITHCEQNVSAQSQGSSVTMDVRVDYKYE